MKRVFWTVGLGLTGFLIGGIGGRDEGSILGLAWGASIGYGFGSIFNQTQATKKIVAYWGGTLALVGPFFSLIIGAPYASLLQQATVAGVGVVAGALLGLLVGTIQFKLLRRRSQAPSSGVVP